MLSQRYPDLEYIVIDGGSTDGSVEIIKKYEDRLAHWESGKDGGQYDAITKKCQYPASTRSAAQTCQAHGGYYDTGADVCEMGQE